MGKEELFERTTQQAIRCLITIAVFVLYWDSLLAMKILAISGCISVEIMYFIWNRRAKCQ